MVRRVTLIAVVAASALSCLQSCETLAPWRRELNASLRVDSTEIAVRVTSAGYYAKIPFVYVNTTEGPVAKSGCGFPPLPELLKKVNDKWVAAYYPVYPMCLTKPDFSLPPGGIYRGVLDFSAAKPGQHMEPSLQVDSIDGVYRLEWDFVEGTDGGVKNARIVKAISNEFRMVSQ